MRGLLAAAGAVFDLEPKTFQTQGDKDKLSSLADHAVDDFFTDALDKAVLGGEIDVAVHSAKDVPRALAPGLEIIALTKAPDETDAFIGRKKLADLPPGARVGTSSGLRRNELLRLRPDVQAVSIRGTIEERVKQFEDGAYDGIIVATVALKRLGLQGHITEILPWEAASLQGQLAVVARADNAAMRELFAAIDVRRCYGTVHLVGAGPGDPELVTLKAVKALAQADVVFYDYLAHKNILRHAVKAEKIYVGKRKGDHALLQKDLCSLLRRKAQQGLDVVRLKGGDPLIFGRGAEEMAYLHDYHIPYDVVPGISAATGILSGLGIPLTARDVSSSVAFISGHAREESDEEPLPVEIPKADTQVFFMGLSKIDLIVDTLLRQGRSAQTPVAVISRGTFTDEQVATGTLAGIREIIRSRNILPPALIVVGETVRFLKGRAMGKKNILFTGTNPEKYATLGNIIAFPLIQIGPMRQPVERLEALVTRLDEYHAVLLTSQFGVKYFFDVLCGKGVGLEALKGKDFFIIGRHTADTLAEFGFYPCIVANLETSQGLLKEIVSRYDVRGKRILFPRSNLPNPLLREKLTEAGATVDEIAVYENTKAAKRPLPDTRIDTVFFTSPSTVRNFLEDHGAIPRDWEIVVKGDVTAEFLKNHGYDSEILINI